MTFKWKRVHVEDIEFNMAELPDDAYWELATEVAKEFNVSMWCDGTIFMSHELFSTPAEWSEHSKTVPLLGLVKLAISDEGICGEDRHSDLQKLLDALDHARELVAAEMTHNAGMNGA